MKKTAEKQTQQEMTPWDTAVCKHLDDLWDYAHSDKAVFHTPEETRAIIQSLIDEIPKKQDKRDDSISKYAAV